MTTFVKRNVKYLTQMAQFENYSSFPGAFKKYFKTLIRLHKTFFQISFSRKFYNYIVTKKKTQHLVTFISDTFIRQSLEQTKMRIFDTLCVKRHTE